MAIEILMPALSPTMESGKLATWNIAVGGEVRIGDVIAEIETDKATMEVEAVDDGVLAVILVAAGSENVSVGTPIARLAEDGEAVGDVASAPAAAAPSPPVADSKVETPEPSASAPAANLTPDSMAAAAPKAGSEGPRLFASPLARRIAGENNIDLSGLTGSGPHGRILRSDVEAAISSSTAKVVTNSLGMAAQNTLAERGASSLEPNSRMRKVIAHRLQESKANAPHFYLTVDCEIDTLLAARKVMNEQSPDDIKISVNDLVIRAAAMALVKVPKANASWEGEHTRLFHHADIAMAVAVDGGLVTPVIWAAEQKGLAEIGATSRDLAARARSFKLKPDELAGGSFTISNLGMFGIREFAAVINPPQGAILAVGAGEERPIVRNGHLAVATLMTVTLSADHRVVDGAVGAEWLQAFKGYIEAPVTMLL